MGSRVTGRATPDSDYDVILLVRGDGALRLSNFETTPASEAAWGWLLPEDAAILAFAPDAQCDVMLADASSHEYTGKLFFDTGPHALLWPIVTGRVRRVHTPV